VPVHQSPVPPFDGRLSTVSFFLDLLDSRPAALDPPSVLFPLRGPHFPHSPKVRNLPGKTQVCVFDSFFHTRSFGTSPSMSSMLIKPVPDRFFFFSLERRTHRSFPEPLLCVIAVSPGTCDYPPPPLLGSPRFFFYFLLNPRRNCPLHRVNRRAAFPPSSPVPTFRLPPLSPAAHLFL